MLRKIIEFFRPSKIPQLTQEEINALRELASSANWHIFCQVLDKQVLLYNEAMLAESRPEMLQYYRGMITGLRQGPIVVAKIIQQESKDARRERTRADDSLYGTGFAERIDSRAAY